MNKLIMATLAVALLVFFGVAQAGSDVPQILSSLETGAYQRMSDAQMDAVAGELMIYIDSNLNLTFDAGLDVPLFLGTNDPTIPPTGINIGIGLLVIDP